MASEPTRTRSRILSTVALIVLSAGVGAVVAHYVTDQPGEPTSESARTGPGAASAAVAPAVPVIPEPEADPATPASKQPRQDEPTDTPTPTPADPATGDPTAPESDEAPQPAPTRRADSEAPSLVAVVTPPQPAPVPAAQPATTPTTAPEPAGDTAVPDEAEPADSGEIDYDQLNRDLIAVADALDRFNEKLRESIRRNARGQGPASAADADGNDDADPANSSRPASVADADGG